MGGDLLSRGRLVKPGRLSPNADGVVVPANIPPYNAVPSQPEGLGARPDRLIGLPPANFPPAGAPVVDQMGDVNLAGGASGVIFTQQVPDGLTLRVAGIGFGADDESMLRFLSWFIRVSPPEIPVQGYNFMSAAIGSLQQLSPVTLQIGSSQLMDVVATNGSAIPFVYRFVCRVQGWFYNQGES